MPIDRDTVAGAVDYLRASESETLADQVAVCEIPAPPFGELARSEDYRERFTALGLDNVRVDGREFSNECSARRR